MEPSRKLVIAGRYRLHEEIGRGGVGSVWRAHSVALDIPCAVKFLLPQYAKDPGQRARFIHEARAAAGLRSPHTVSVFDVDEWEGQPFIAMELLSGQSLERCIEEQGRLTPHFTCEVVRQIALGLSKAHAAGLVHRDLKPDNVFLLDDENSITVKILDFGIAKRVDMSVDFKTVTGTLIGTPYYMSPEQAKGSKEIDFKSDLWSLAVVAYRCLTGRLPFDGENLPDILLKIVHGPLPTLSGVDPALPRTVEAWWRGAVNRDPARRPPSALALAQGLSQALLGKRSSSGTPEHLLSGTRARPDNLAAHASGRSFRAPVALALLGVALLAGAGVFYWFVRPGFDAEQNSAAFEHRVVPSAGPSTATAGVEPRAVGAPTEPEKPRGVATVPEAREPAVKAPAVTEPAVTESAVRQPVQGIARQAAPAAADSAGRAATSTDAERRKDTSRKLPEERAKPATAKPKSQPKADSPVLDDRLGF
jgi:hypothetical protein